MRFFYATLLFFSLSASLFAQNGLPNGGARSLSMGQANLLYQDAQAIWSNQAGLAFNSDWGVALYGSQPFGLGELGRVGMGLSYALGQQGSLGLSIEQFGMGSDYRDQKLGLAYARKLFKHTALALQFDYLATRITGYGQAHRFTAELGMQTKINEEWEFGLHIYNPFPVSLPNEDRLPSLFRLGLGYRPNEHLLLSVQADKDLRYPLSGRLGLEYQLHPYVSLRAGYATGPATASFGLGLHIQNFNLDLGTAYHNVLGFSPALGLSYQPKKKEQEAPKEN